MALSEQTHVDPPEAKASRPCTEEPGLGALFVTLRARVTGHFLRRLEERGGNANRLVLEGDSLEVSGWLWPLRHHDYNFVVPGFGQIRLRLSRRGPAFVAVTFLPFGGS